MVRLGDLAPVEDSDNQLIFPCGVIHERPVKFLLTQAVTKSPDFAHPAGPMTIKDSKSALMLTTTGVSNGTEYAYRVSGEGEVRNPALRLRMVVAGFVRYGEMDKVGDTDVAFPCRQRHDGLVRLLLPYSRNISAVESMLEAEATRGPDDHQHPRLQPALGTQGHLTMVELSKIEKVDLRKIWKHEAQDFTPWLADTYIRARRSLRTGY